MLNLLDFLGMVFGLWATYLYVRENILAWPVALVGIVVDIGLYYRTGIYGDMSLSFFYLLSTLYGWYAWRFGGENHQSLTVHHASKKLVVTIFLLATTVIIILMMLLKYYAHSQVPLLDATTTVLSVVAQWFLCRKFMENWLLWSVVDSIYIGLYAYKGLDFHAIMSFVYLLLAVMGYVNWLRVARQQSLVFVRTND